MLEKLIIDLYEKVNKRAISIENRQVILELLKENDLYENRNIPLWFIDLIKNVLVKKDVIRTFYERKVNEGDIGNFLAELEDIIEAEWSDYGEAVEVFFPNINMWICISREGDFYEAFYREKNSM